MVSHFLHSLITDKYGTCEYTGMGEARIRLISPISVEAVLRAFSERGVKPGPMSSLCVKPWLQMRHMTDESLTKLVDKQMTENICTIV